MKYKACDETIVASGIGVWKCLEWIVYMIPFSTYEMDSATHLYCYRSSLDHSVLQHRF